MKNLNRYTQLYEMFHDRYIKDPSKENLFMRDRFIKLLEDNFQYNQDKACSDFDRNIKNWFQDIELNRPFTKFKK